MKNDFPIDFVIPWVDGSDSEWIREFEKYAPQDKKVDARSVRFRDYGLMRHWFRGVEKFAPWVNKIHFVTCGQKPEWLNLQNPKLHWVRHSDYIPPQFLPTFSANPIEICMHKIPGLSEHFVYFNDDFFLTDFVSPDFYFCRGLPKDCALMEIKCDLRLPMLGIVFNDLNLINENFCKRKVISKNFFKWFSPKYGKSVWRNISLLPWPKFPGFVNTHFPQPFRKSTLEEVWLECEKELLETMQNKFRSPFDVNQWLFRHWRLCKGDFAPERPHKKKRFFSIADENVLEIAECVKNSRYKEIVINDSELQDFERAKKILLRAFEKLLPQKSSFEI